MLKRFLKSSILVILWSTAVAQKIRTIVPRQPVVVGNAFQLQFIITDPTGFTDLVPPAFDSLRLVSGPNHYKGNASIDGRTQQIENITYTLVASRPGTIRLKAATANFKNGPEERSDDIVIQVLPHPRASFSARSSYTDPALYTPSTKTDLEKLIAENLFIRAEVSKTSVFIGEAVVATFKLYSRLQSTSEVLNSPSLYGFSVIDILNINEAHQSVESINGKVFNTSILRKLQLYPERSGELVIDEMQLDNQIEFIDSFTNNKSVVEKILVSQPVRIQVKAHPANKPDPFTGAVGQFSIETLLDRPVIAEMEQGKLTVRIRGRGNFIQFGQPVLRWPDHFDVFEPEVRERVVNQVTPTEGIREYIFGFSTDSSGHYVLPPVLFSYYDPAAAKFKTIKTDSLQLNVQKGKSRLHTILPDSGGGRGYSYLLFFVILVIAAAALFLYRSGKKKMNTAIVAPAETIKFSVLLEQINTETLDEKNTCLEIRRVLMAARKEFPDPGSMPTSEWQRIQDECQELVYSGLNDDHKKLDLKQRAYRLLKDLEENSKKGFDS